MKCISELALVESIQILNKEDTRHAFEFVYEALVEVLRALSQ